MKLKIFYYWFRKWLLIKLSLLGYPIFAFLISWRKRNYGDAPRILVIPQFTRIGDLVCATPMFRLIKKHLPKSHLAVLVTRRTAPIIKNNPNIDEIIFFNSFDFAKRVLEEVRAKRFDWCFNISATAIGSLVSLYGLIPNRVKLTRRPRPLAEVLTDWIANYKLRYEHHTYLPRYYLKMLEFIGMHDAEEVSQVFVSPEGEEKVGKWLMENGIKTSDMVVGISIAAQNKIKEWGDEKFKQVAKYVNRQYGAKVLFLGIKNHESRIKGLISDLNPRDFFAAVDLSLEELPSLMKRLNLYIAVDTGPIYIAHALKVPLIDITGPCDPDEQPPQDAISAQVRPPTHIKSSSFVIKRAGEPEEHKRALEATPVEKVLETINQSVACSSLRKGVFRNGV